MDLLGELPFIAHDEQPAQALSDVQRGDGHGADRIGHLQQLAIRRGRREELDHPPIMQAAPDVLRKRGGSDHSCGVLRPPATQGVAGLLFPDRRHDRQLLLRFASERQANFGVRPDQVDGGSDRRFV